MNDVTLSLGERHFQSIDRSIHPPIVTTVSSIPITPLRFDPVDSVDLSASLRIPPIAMHPIIIHRPQFGSGDS